MVLGMVMSVLLMLFGVLGLLSGGPFWSQHLRFLTSVNGSRSSKWQAWQRSRIIILGALLVVIGGILAGTLLVRMP